MTFIKAGVGAGGVNNAEDVKVIQWLLNQAENGYRFMSSLAKDDNLTGVNENGIMSSSTQLAIDDWSRFCDKIGLPRDKPAIYRGIKIEPGSQYYNRLIFGVVLKATGKPFINISDNYQDPRVKEALDGRITFEQFKVIIKQAKGNTLTAFGSQMQMHLANPQVQVFLDLIAKAETWFDNRFEFLPYDMKVGFVKMNDLYQHPGTVAGRYQFTKETWATAKSKCGLYDFTPESQDIAGVYLLATLPASLSSSPYPLDDKILPFVLAGDATSIAYAIELASGTWASFPTKYEKDKKTGKWQEKTNFDPNSENESRYSPQRNAPLTALLEAYKKYLKAKSEKK